MHQSEAQPSIRVGQIIIFALMMGVCSFGAVVFLFGNQNPPPQGMPLVAYMGAGNSFLMICIWFAVPLFVSRGVRQKIMDKNWGNLSEDEQFLATMGAYQTMTIIKGAVIEGACFFNLVAYMIHKEDFSLIITGVLLFFLLLTFPTHSKYENWVRRETEKIQLM